MTTVSARTVRGMNDLTRFAIAMAMAKNDPVHANLIFQDRHPLSVVKGEIERITRAAVAAGSTGDASFGPLIQSTSFARAAIEYAAATSIVGRMASSFRTVPPLSSIPRATVGMQANWVGEGVAMPIVSGALDTVSFPRLPKIGITTVASQELVRIPSLEVIAFFREMLNDAVVQATDSSFLDSSAGAFAGLRPAGIVNGAPTVASTGTTAAAFGVDFRALVNLITTDLTKPFLLMRPKVALNLAALGGDLTRNAKVEGGDIAGIPILTSTNVPRLANSPADDQIVLIDANEILYSDGGIEFDSSTQASIQMDNAPDSPPVASTVAVSLFQSNLLAIKLLRFISWQQRKSGAVGVLTGVSY